MQLTAIIIWLAETYRNHILNCSKARKQKEENTKVVNYFKIVPINEIIKEL